MIVIGTTSNRAAWDYFAQAQSSGLDFVCWGSPGSPFHGMSSENDIGGPNADEHFIATGRRSKAFIGPQPSRRRQFDGCSAGFAASIAARGHEIGRASRREKGWKDVWPEEVAG